MTGARHLDWDGCVNVRDLGGLPLESGGSTRSGVVVRADDIGALTSSGWQALSAYGVRTALDLRFEEERTPHPPHASPIDVVHVPLFGRVDRAVAARVDRMVVDAPDGGTAIRLFYVDVLRAHGTRVAAAIEAIAAATKRGTGVVVHCAIGKDRTGIVSALLLRLAGVPADAVADDYALSHDRVEPLVADWIESAGDDAERELRSRFGAAPREGMSGMLEELDASFGGAEGYLRAQGVAAATLDALSARLVPGPG